MKKLINIPKLIRNLWIILWIVEFILIVMKLCFNIWYPIVIENELILKLSDFITNNVIVNYAIMFILYVINFNFVYLIIIKNKFYKSKIELLLINILIVIIFIVKKINNDFGMIFEVIGLFIVPMIRTRKILFPIIVNVLVMVWQLNILFIRDINELLKDMPFMIYFAIQIDYYIFLIITWIGVNYYMSLVGVWFFGRRITKYEALKEKELAKKFPDFKYVDELDKKITDLKARMK